MNDLNRARGDYLAQGSEVCQSNHGIGHNVVAQPVNLHSSSSTVDYLLHKDRTNLVQRILYGIDDLVEGRHHLLIVPANHLVGPSADRFE